VDLLTIGLNLRTIFAIENIDAPYPKGIVTLQLGVLQVLAMSSNSQIAQPIVRRIAINVINLPRFTR